MFGGVRQGSLVYILNKTTNGAELKIGTVDSFSNPQPKYGAQMSVYGQPESTIDIRAKCGEEVFELKQLPTSLGITSINGLVVSDNKEAMSAEVEAMQRTSKQILDSVDYHTQVIEQCEGMLRTLNPQFAKEKEQEEKIGALEEKMGNIEDTLTNIQSMLSSALSASNHNKTRNKEE